MYPAMIKAGYPKRFAHGLVTSAGTLGILIPPSHSR
jgi:C4-dicarboxylate transporter DctM subunit